MTLFQPMEVKSLLICYCDKLIMGIQCLQEFKQKVVLKNRRIIKEVCLHIRDMLEIIGKDGKISTIDHMLSNLEEVNRRLNG